MMEQQPEYAAFPQVEMRDHYGMLVPYRQTGMTLRDYFAAQALNGLLACGEAHNEHTSSVTAAAAYQIADAMLAAREEKP